jgi:hypothetical protein
MSESQKPKLSRLDLGRVRVCLLGLPVTPTPKLVEYCRQCDDPEGPEAAGASQQRMEVRTVLRRYWCIPSDLVLHTKA